MSKFQQQRKDMEALHTQQLWQREEEEKRRVAADSAAKFAAIAAKETRAKQQRLDDEDRLNKEERNDALSARVAKEVLERQRLQLIIDQQNKELEEMTEN